MAEKPVPGKNQWQPGDLVWGPPLPGSEAEKAQKRGKLAKLIKRIKRQK